MIAHVLAVDYDGTVAEKNRVAPETVAALDRVRESGRRIVLVTGRRLPDLRHVCPEADRLFDAVVAENGALLYVPERREVTPLGDAPEPALVQALRRRAVAFDLGTSVVATTEAFAEPALAAIRETGVERSLVFNKGSLMLLPGGVTKGTGLSAALAAMELSAHNVVGIGDAENDHAFLGLTECAVAVADAVPALRERADYVTRGGAGRGVVEFVDEHLLADLATLVRPGTRLAARHRLVLGDTGDGANAGPVGVPAHGARLLVVGPSGSGKSTLTGVLAERLVAAGRSLCLLDPEGDYRTLGELPGVVVFGGDTQQALPTPDELAQLLRRPELRLVLDLSALTLAEKVAYATRALAVVSAVRATSGLPHWLVIDEAHHVLPADGAPAAELLRPGGESLALITLEVERLAREVLPLVNVAASTDMDGLRGALRTLRAAPPPLDRSEAPLARGEAVIAWLGEAPRAARFRVARREVEHRRHVRKYVEGELPPERSFYFRGANGRLNLRAANLTRFRELAEGVDEATWTHHLRRGDYSRWMRDAIKDGELADEVGAVERRTGVASAESRALVLEAVRRRYAV